MSVFWGEHGPCYRCMFPTPPPPGLVPNCAEGGVLGILPGTVGTMQATEVIKLIVGTGEPLIGKMLLYDAQEMDFTKINVRKDPNCPVCGIPHEEVELIDYEQFCGMPAHDKSEFNSLEELTGVLNSFDSSDDGEITVKQLKARWDAGEDLYVLDVRNPVEWEIAALDNTVRIPKPDIEKARLAIEQGRAELADTVIGEIPDDREVIVHCRSGVRSADTIEILKQLGYKNKLVNLKGGILAWADEIDNAMPTY